jgi:phenylacetate-coenzyme A ligase PaaK-like adenylate-forming protein
MDLALAGRLLLCDLAARRRERWSPQRIAGFQAKRLQQLRRFAQDRSLFYKRLHKGFENRPLSELPILTKRLLMDGYDDIVTDRAIRLADVRHHLESDPAEPLYRGRYQVCATSGTSGQPGVFLYDPKEWAWVLASYARANRLAGVTAGLLHGLRIAMVGSSRRWHQSSAVAESLDSSWFPSLRLAATDPVADICRELTAWKPQLLITYAAISGVLADEQLAGRLDIAPSAVMCVAETLTSATRAKVREAWGAEPFENYASTEAACVAAECRRHTGLHLFDDFLVTEVVDESNRPVPPGTMGAKALVSVLFSRTLPLIRYELDDATMLASGDCGCGLPFRRLTRIGGRIAETLRIPRPDGTTAVLHPTHFEDVIGLTDVRRWQVLRRHDGLHVRLVAPVSDTSLHRVEAGLRQLGQSLDVGHLSVTLEVVDDIERTASGKMILVQDATTAPPSKASGGTQQAR